MELVLKVTKCRKMVRAGAGAMPSMGGKFISSVHSSFLWCVISDAVLARCFDFAKRFLQPEVDCGAGAAMQFAIGPLPDLSHVVCGPDRSV